LVGISSSTAGYLKGKSLQLYSTQQKSAPVSFREALLQGLAPDGGLFMPTHLPRLAPACFAAIRTMTFVDLAGAVMGALLEDEIPAPVLRAIVADAFTFPVPLGALDERTHMLELFHGPTLAFKDFGARFMARAMAYFARDKQQARIVLVATSGDTGSAVAQGFRDVPGVRVVLLYPQGKVSTIQERQLTTAGENVHAVAICGTFDDCQRLVKAAFLDEELGRHLALTSANSINIARLLPQMLPYFWAYARLPELRHPLVFAVPSGNFGNLTAGLMAQRMGLPVARFVAATNANDVVPRYLQSGQFHAQPSRQTLSTAMDVGNPSNFVRMLALYAGDRASMRADIAGFSFTDAQTKAAIGELFNRYGYVADPHTAVGYLGWQRFVQEQDRPVQGVVLATAHPAKFPDCLASLLDITVDVPEQLQRYLDGEPRVISLPNDYAALRAFLTESIS
jgi:threonine synthase